MLVGVSASSRIAVGAIDGALVVGIEANAPRNMQDSHIYTYARVTYIHMQDSHIYSHICTLHQIYIQQTQIHKPQMSGAVVH